MSDARDDGRRRGRLGLPIPVILGFLVGCAFTAVLTLFVFNDRAGSIELVLSNDKKVVIDVAEGQLHYVDVLNNIMRANTEEQKAIRSVALSVLSGEYDVYRYGTPELVDRIGREPDNSDYAGEFIDLVTQRRGPFNMTTLYDFSDPRTVDYIRRLDYENAFVMALRQEILDGSANLWPQEHEVTVLFSDRIPPGRAAVCKQSEFRGNKLRLFHPGAGGIVKTVGIFPLPREECETEPNAWVQIGIQDGNILLDGATLDRREEAWAKAEPMHQTEEPVTPVLADALRTTTGSQD